MKKFIITLLCLAIVAGGSYAAYTQVQKKKDDKRVAEVYPVSVLCESGWGQQKTFDGTVTSGSLQEVNLSTDKLVKKVCVNAGDKVKKGDTLIEYDMTIVELETEQKKNQVALIEQDIFDAQNELARLKTLQPSELKPKEQEEPEPEDFEEDLDEEDPEEFDGSLDDSKPATSSRAQTTEPDVSEQDDSLFLPADDSELPDLPQDDDTELDVSLDETLSSSEETSSADSESTDHSTVDSSSSAADSSDGSSGSLSSSSSSAADTPADYSAYIDQNGMLTALYSSEQADDTDESGTLAFNCTMNTQISADFMNEVISKHLHAVLYVYDNSGENLLYFWDINGAANNNLAAYDWKAGDGVVSFRGMISYDGSAGGKCGLFFVYTAIGDTDDTDTTIDEENDSFPDDEEEFSEFNENDNIFDLEETDKFDFDDSEFLDDDEENDNENIDENYLYSRTELAKMIQEKESDIKNLQIDLKTAKLEYDASLKRKETGKVVAEIDGVVTKCGAESVNSQDEEYLYADNIDGEFDFSYEESEKIDDVLADDEEENSAYIVITGNEGVSVEINVGELFLDEFKEGTQINVMSFYDGASYTATVTGVKDDPYSYNSNWDDNPNSSIFRVTADLEDDPAISIGSDVMVNLDDLNYYDSDMICLPMSYLHKEGMGYYVMKQGKDGLLEKQKIVSGKNYYGSFLEVKKGLTMDDLIAFPYGKTAKEGTKTKECDAPDYY